MSIPALPRTLLIMGVMVWCSAPRAHAAVQRIECPKEIPRQAVQVTRSPAGWEAFVPFEYRQGVPLVDAGVMFGPPSGMAEVKPESGPGNVAKWSDLHADSEGLWMACQYGDAGRRDFIMAKRLDDATTECTVTYGKRAEKRVRLDIRCR
jgi:hypothetical protein